jgi:hypothetical protein
MALPDRVTAHRINDQPFEMEHEETMCKQAARTAFAAMESAVAALACSAGNA